jgi:hypothetical protein
VNGTRKQNRRYKQINFIALQNNRHPSQHTVGNVHKAPLIMLFRRGNRMKSTYRTPLIWRLQAPDQGSTVDFFMFLRLKSIMKGARFADVVAIQERVTAVLRSDS